MRHVPHGASPLPSLRARSQLQEPAALARPEPLPETPRVADGLFARLVVHQPPGQRHVARVVSDRRRASLPPSPSSFACACGSMSVPPRTKRKGRGRTVCCSTPRRTLALCELAQRRQAGRVDRRVRGVLTSQRSESARVRRPHSDECERASCQDGGCGCDGRSAAGTEV